VAVCGEERSEGAPPEASTSTTRYRKKDSHRSVREPNRRKQDRFSFFYLNTFILALNPRLGSVILKAVGRD
jgi:hypothetical protein